MHSPSRSDHPFYRETSDGPAIGSMPECGPGRLASGESVDLVLDAAGPGTAVPDEQRPVDPPVTLVTGLDADVGEPLGVAEVGLVAPAEEGGHHRVGELERTGVVEVEVGAVVGAD